MSFLTEFRIILYNFLKGIYDNRLLFEGIETLFGKAQNRDLESIENKREIRFLYLNYFIINTFWPTVVHLLSYEAVFYILYLCGLERFNLYWTLIQFVFIEIPFTVYKEALNIEFGIEISDHLEYKEYRGKKHRQIAFILSEIVYDILIYIGLLIQQSIFSAVPLIGYYIGIFLFMIMWSFAIFDFKWAMQGVPLNVRLTLINKRFIYFCGFSVIPTLLVYSLPQPYGKYLVASLYPLYLFAIAGVEDYGWSGYLNINFFDIPIYIADWLYYLIKRRPLIKKTYYCFFDIIHSIANIIRYSAYRAVVEGGIYLHFCEVILYWFLRYIVRLRSREKPHWSDSRFNIYKVSLFESK